MSYATTIVCDTGAKCGLQIHVASASKIAADKMAEAAGWLLTERGHLCPRCKAARAEKGE